LCAYTDAELQRRLTPDEYTRVRAWWDGFLKDETLLQAPRCVVHGDLWPQNMLVDESGRELLGIIDFGDAGVIDAAYDFACLRLSPSLYEGALASYRDRGGMTDGGFEHRVQRWWELRSGSWYSLRAALRTDDAAEVDDAISQLRRSPILAS
jgi:aminoglycoside phosphotransferase (APT) family kinase protein